MLDHGKIAGDSSDINIQSHPHIQTDIPPIYLDVVIPRTELLTDIQTKLQSDSIVVIQGGVDTGKTTLAKLTANAIDADWFWLNLTKKDPSQVAQLLQQLASAVSNESSQINVVLDDLNLQPQQLRTYKEELGVVVYRVLERGAKLLITSQYNPPNNLIRSLGLSSSVVVNAPNFIRSEIAQFAQQLRCPADDLETWVTFIQAHTSGHPRLVHARLTQLRDEGWKQSDLIESMIQTPQVVKKEREAARQLLIDLPEDRREFLYRLSLLTEFRQDYALNIGEIPNPISYPGDVFSQLVGPWIDQVSENYYTISPLLTNAAKEVWSDDKIKGLHAYIANAILETKKLTTTEARAVLTHSIVGENKEGLVSVIQMLMTAPEDSWGMLSQEFAWLRYIKIDPHEELFPGNVFVNQLFRSLQYRIAVEVEPEFAPKILEIWDKETKPYEPRHLYLLSRLILATEVLRFNQVSLPAKKVVGYLKEMIDIKDREKEAWEIFYNSMVQLEAGKTDKSNFFSILFSFIYARQSIYAPFLSDLIDELDELNPRILTLLLADFEGDNIIEARLLIDGVWWAEANLESPNWTRCLQVFDRVIEKTIEWGYPNIAAASARGKAIIHDEYLNAPDTAHEVLQDITSKLGPLPAIEEARAFVYLHQKNYKEALNIYECILPKWNPPLEQLGIGPLEEYRRAAICAACLDDWKKAAAFFEDGAKRTHETVNVEGYVGFYADAGFAHFKAGNMLNCIKFLHLALQNFEMLPQDNTDVKYFTLKKRLEHIIKWIKTIWYEWEDNASELFEPFVGFCSDAETKEEFLTLPDCPIGYPWFYLSQIEYRFGHETTVFQHALQITDRDAYPELNFLLSVLETQYDFKNKTFDNLPRRIHQLMNVCDLMQEHYQSMEKNERKEIGSLSIANLSNLASVENITTFFVSALLTQLSTNRDVHETLTIWRTNSLGLPIKDNMAIALNLIESILFGDQNDALTLMKTQESKYEERLVAALKVVQDKKTNPANLFGAHTLITTFLIDYLTWLDPLGQGLAGLLSAQWLEKIKFRAALKAPMLTVPEIEQACSSSETGKKKIGRILLAAHQAVSLRVPSETLQKFRTWAELESEQKQEPTTGKNSAAQNLIKVMEKPPHLTDEDITALHQSIEEGKIPINFNSPFEPDEHEKE